MIQVDDLSRSLIAFEQISTLVIVVELSQSSWLAAGVVPRIERRPLRKLDPDPTAEAQTSTNGTRYLFERVAALYTSFEFGYHCGHFVASTMCPQMRSQEALISRALCENNQPATD